MEYISIFSFFSHLGMSDFLQYLFGSPSLSMKAIDKIHTLVQWFSTHTSFDFYHLFETIWSKQVHAEYFDKKVL